MNGCSRRRKYVAILAAVFSSCLVVLSGDLTVDNLAVHESVTVNSNLVVWGSIVMPVPGSIPTNGMQLHYTFDCDSGSQVVDSSGKGNHGLLVGAVTYEAGKKGLSARFTSPGTHIVCSSGSLNLKGAAGFSVSVWAMPRYLTAYGSVIARADCARKNTLSGFAIRVPGDRRCPGVDAWVYTNAQQTVYLSSAPRAEVNRWCHLVLTYDGKTTKLYVDGVLVSSASSARQGIPLYDITRTKLIIGNTSTIRQTKWDDQYFNGQVDDLRIYSRALTGDEVARLFIFTMQDGGGSFDVVGRFPKGIGYVAPLGDLSMGTYTNRP